MRAPVSVIIPTLNARQDLPRCLGALGEGLEAGLIRELIISDGGSTDGTLSIAEQAGAMVVSGQPSRGGQLRRGASFAAGEWLLFLHADTLLMPGWADAVLAHVDKDSPAYFRLKFASRHPLARMTAGWANLRSRVFGLPYGDQGLLIRRKDYQAAGGFPDIPLMEDVALVRALRGRLIPLDATALTSAERYERDGWLRRGGRNLITLLRYLAGAAPAKLVRGYTRSR